MIEVVSGEGTLKDRGGRSHSCYLEVYGETRPIVNVGAAEVTPATDPTASGMTPPSAPIYEYWWTLGHRIEAQEGKATGDVPSDMMASAEQRGRASFWDALTEVNGAAAHVYLFFPVSGNWRIKEVTATLKYLSPVPNQSSWWEAAAKGLKEISPLAQDASQLAGLIPNPAFAGASQLLGTIAKLQVNSVPPSDSIKWSVMKVTTGHPPRGVKQGVAWNLPASAFRILGSRVTGSVAVSVIPASFQEPDHDNTPSGAAAGPVLERRAIEAHAVIYGPDGQQLWIPGSPPSADTEDHQTASADQSQAQEQFIYLHVTPQLPGSPQPSAETKGS